MTPVHFGTLHDGRSVSRVTIASEFLSVELLDFGARLHAVRLGEGPNMAVSGALSDYEGRLIYAGPVIGPVVNRITGAEAEIAGRICRFDANYRGRHTLHSGHRGTQVRLWRIEAQAPDRVDFAIELPDGEGGFPGNRTIRAEYRVAGADLTLSIHATTDRTTLMNPASHGVWNLNGGAHWAGHRLEVPAERYLPVDDDTLPTGEIAPVAGTRYDHRGAREPDPTLDHNFCFDPAAAPRRLARLVAPSGRCLEILSDAVGLQAYAGGPTGIALEPQSWPDAPHHPAFFPSILLQPGQTFSQSTILRFSSPAPAVDGVTRPASTER